VIVIADTSPINYLILIGEIDLLPKLYSEIVIPQAVADELRSPDAPGRVRAWIAAIPDWLSVKAPVPTHDQRLSGLDSGERDAIALALQLNAELVLIDERDARSVAQICGLSVAGTLRVLSTAASRNLVDLESAFELLQKSNFRANPGLFDALLAQDRARK
jgi:predicted nucleic acid-binding protein